MNESTKRPRGKKGQKLTPNAEEYFAKQVEQGKEFLEESSALIKEAEEEQGGTPLGVLKALTNKSKEEIIESGTPKEVGYLFSVHTCSVIDKKAFSFTPREVLQIHHRLTYKEASEANDIFSYVVAIKQFESTFSYSVLMFQKDAAYLAKTVQEWKGYERLAEALTDLYKSGTLGSGLTQERLEEIASSIKLENKCSLYYDKSSDSFKVDIGDVEDGHSLRRLIRMRKAFVRESMRIVKGEETAMRHYIEKRNLPEEVIPFLKRLCITDMHKEYYLSGLLEEECYYASKLPAGAPLTEEALEKAVFPNYETMEPSQGYVQKCLNDICTSERLIRLKNSPLEEE